MDFPWDFSWGRSPRAPAEASRSILVEALELTWDRVQDSLFFKLRFTCCFPVFYDLLCVYVFTLHENLMLSDVICIYSSYLKDDSMIECRVSEGLIK